MKKKETIKSKQTFNDIINNSPFFKNRSFVIYIKKKNSLIPNFGIAISKKTGNAVTRNKLKRQTRVIIDELKENFSNYQDYIIMIKKKCVELSFHEMKRDFKNLLEEIK